MQTLKYLIALLLIINIGCKNNVQDEQPIIQSDPFLLQLDASQERNAKISTGKLLSNTQAQTIRAYGKTFFPSESVITVTSPFGGAIRSIHVIQGQYVSQGQVVASIEDARFVDLQQDYLLTKSKLKLTQLDYERQRELNQAKASSDKVYQVAENEYRTQQILLKSLSEKLMLLGINPHNLNEKNITRTIAIRATSSGYITNVYANKGRYILPSESLVDILNQSKPCLKLKIYDKDVSNVRIGMKVIAFSSNDTSVKYPCQVLSILPQMQQDGSTEVLCSFIHLNKTLPQNLNLIADIEVSSNATNSLPESAVVDFEGKKFVFEKLEQGKYKMIPIQIGNSQHQQVEIVNHNELNGKNIVMNGAYILLMALKNKE
ncbi:MAG: efflux RND transporter periplasmic adaptor subunit [Chitinophagales bacterium]|nr:efflux RND transporter periplasmic adaptor subunit [Chitinophagales bacterium]